MVEHVPVEYWSWIIPEVKKQHPNLIFLGEAYDVNKYGDYLFNGHFDYLYDKVGLYDSLKRLIRQEANATIWDINRCVFHESAGFPEHMLRFLENHDEERIASGYFAGDAWLAVPAMIVSATLSTGPVMIYSGQEVGEPAIGNPGFNTGNGRTTIFDYWGVPEHQKWLNNGKFDGGQLSAPQKQLRGFYATLLNISGQHEAITSGKFYELMLINLNEGMGFDERIYAYLRYTEKESILVLVNFHRDKRDLVVKLPADLIADMKIEGQITFTDLLSNQNYNVDDIAHGFSIVMTATSGFLLSF
jgi:glycosidase